MAPLFFQIAAACCIIASHGGSSFMPNNLFHHSRNTVSSSSQEATSPEIAPGQASRVREALPTGMLPNGLSEPSKAYEHPAPPNDGIHVFVLVHGLAGKADDLAYLASQLEAQGGRRVAVLRPTCNEGTTTDGVLAGATRVAVEVRTFVKAHREAAAAASAAARTADLGDSVVAPSTAPAGAGSARNASDSVIGSDTDHDAAAASADVSTDATDGNVKIATRRKINSNSSRSNGGGDDMTGGGALTSISFVGHSLGGLYARLAVALLFDPIHGTVAGLVPESFVTVATPHLGVRRFTYVPTDWVPDLGARVLSRLVAGQTGLELFLADEPTSTSEKEQSSSNSSSGKNDKNGNASTTDSIKFGVGRNRSARDRVESSTDPTDDSTIDDGSTSAADRSNEIATIWERTSPSDVTSAKDDNHGANTDGVFKRNESDEDNWAENVVKWTQDTANWVSAAMGVGEKAEKQEEGKDEDERSAIKEDKEKVIGRSPSVDSQCSKDTASGDKEKAYDKAINAKDSAKTDNNMDDSVEDRGQQEQHQEEVVRRLNARQVPLLYALTTEPICIDALCAFKRRVAYGLVAGDFLVPAATALFDLRHHFDLDHDLDLVADLALEEEEEEEEEGDQTGLETGGNTSADATVAASDDVVQSDTTAAARDDGGAEKDDKKDDNDSDWIARLWESTVRTRASKGQGEESKKSPTPSSPATPSPSPPPLSWWGFEDDKRDRARRARIQRIIRARQAAAAASSSSSKGEKILTEKGKESEEGGIDGSFLEGGGGDPNAFTATSKGRRRRAPGMESFEGADFIVWEKPPATATTGAETTRRRQQGVASVEACEESGEESGEEGSEKRGDAREERFDANGGVMSTAPIDERPSKPAAAVLVELGRDSVAQNAINSATEDNFSNLGTQQPVLRDGEAGAMEKAMAKALDDIGWTKVAVRLQLPFSAPRAPVLNRWRSALASNLQKQQAEKDQDKGRQMREEKGTGANEVLAKRAGAAVVAAVGGDSSGSSGCDGSVDGGGSRDFADEATSQQPKEGSEAKKTIKATDNAAVNPPSPDVPAPVSASESTLGEEDSSTSAPIADINIEDLEEGRWWELTPPLGHNMVVALDRKDGINGLLYDVWQRGRPVMDHAARQLLAELDF